MENSLKWQRLFKTFYESRRIYTKVVLLSTAGKYRSASVYFFFTCLTTPVVPSGGDVDPPLNKGGLSRRDPLGIGGFEKL